MTRLARIVLALLLGASLGLAATGPASANHINFGIPAGSDLIAQRYLYKPDGVKLATLNVYDDNGDKYAKLIPVPILQGTARYMLVFIVQHGGEINVCHQTVQCDDGNYANYAGPVKRVNMAGDCIDALVQVEYPVGGTTYGTSWANFACD